MKRGKEERMRKWGGGAVFLAMQVLEIPAGGRGFPLVIIISAIHTLLLSLKLILSGVKHKLRVTKGLEN